MMRLLGKEIISIEPQPQEKNYEKHEKPFVYYKIAEKAVCRSVFLTI